MGHVRPFDNPRGVIPAVERITAITINGHAAEVHALTIEEQYRAIALTKDVLQETVPTIVGVYTNSSLGRLEQSHVRPPLMKPSAAEIDKIGACLARAGLTPETLYRKVA